MKLKELTDQKKFPYRLKLGMQIADIRSCELADKTGMTEAAIYRIRSNCRASSYEECVALLEAMEAWRPGTLAAIMAVERALAAADPPLLRAHNVVRQRAFT